eukprot:6843963-Alexandrium_andersonii.AAC.1
MPLRSSQDPKSDVRQSRRSDRKLPEATPQGPRRHAATKTIAIHEPSRASGQLHGAEPHDVRH